MLTFTNLNKISLAIGWPCSRVFTVNNIRYSLKSKIYIACHNFNFLSLKTIKVDSGYGNLSIFIHEF